MRKYLLAAALGSLGLALAGCGGGDAHDEVPGQSVNAADGINTSSDASGTTGSTTGDAGGPLNVAGDAEADAKEANTTESNAQ
jgi:hypothetical protein